MERENYLIDSNVAIYFFGMTLSAKSEKFLDKVLSENYAISVINRIELLGFGSLSKKETRVFEAFIDNAIQYDLDELVILKTIQIRKDYNIKLPDAIIAATCLVYNCALISNNIKDFGQRIKGLELVILD